MTDQIPSFTDPAYSHGEGHSPSRLECPACHGDNVHMDDVYMAGRPREDGPVVSVRVDHRGQVEQNVAVPLGIGGFGRRHTITITGWCEMCGSRFGIAFKQHKGQTEVTVTEQHWVPADGTPPLS